MLADRAIVAFGGVAVQQEHLKHGKTSRPLWSPVWYVVHNLPVPAGPTVMVTLALPLHSPPPQAAPNFMLVAVYLFSYACCRVDYWLVLPLENLVPIALAHWMILWNGHELIYSHRTAQGVSFWAGVLFASQITTVILFAMNVSHEMPPAQCVGVAFLTMSQIIALSNLMDDASVTPNKAPRHADFGRLPHYVGGTILLTFYGNLLVFRSFFAPAQLQNPTWALLLASTYISLYMSCLCASLYLMHVRGSICVAMILGTLVPGALTCAIMSSVSWASSARSINHHSML